MEHFEISAKVKVYGLNECSEGDKILIKKAKSATQTSYSPYSNYKVGAAVLLANGIIVCGSNQDNAAYPSGLCAERTALFYANAQYPDVPVVAIAIAAFAKGDYTVNICAPCGSCRQAFAEVEMRYGKNIRIMMCGKDKIYEAASVKDLLPFSFAKENLPK